MAEVVRTLEVKTIPAGSDLYQKYLRVELESDNGLLLVDSGDFDTMFVCDLLKVLHYLREHDPEMANLCREALKEKT